MLLAPEKCGEEIDTAVFYKGKEKKLFGIIIILNQLRGV
jgi:hypothetical protein